MRESSGRGTMPAAIMPQTVRGASETLLSELSAFPGAHLSVAAAVREHHARGESHHPAGLPDAVVFPESNDDVQAIVTACAKHDCAIVPFGAGSSLEGHVNAMHGGISINMTRMNKV